ncbi:MAG: hypothetical protein IKE69_05785 [Thermoguttaceae bacterium]|nr:hypothetical protein [Thermoguttaceae bacterium]
MTQFISDYSPFVDWIPKVSEANNLQLAEIIQLELYRYLLSRTNSFGAVLSQDGALDVMETSAAFQLRFMSLRLTERFVCKSLADLVPLIKPQIDLKANQKAAAAGSLFTLSQFNKFAYMVRLLEYVTQREIFEAFGCRSDDLIKDFLLRFRTSDSLFAESGKDSTLADTRRAVSILYAYGMPLKEFDPKLPDAIRNALNARRCPVGGFSDVPDEKIPTIQSTFAGVYLSHVLDSPEDRITVKSDPAFATATLGFIESMLAPNGGYRMDGLTPSPTLLSTAEAVFTVGMLNDYKYTSMPRKKIISYLDELDQDDSGAAPDEWTQTSDLESTLLGVVVRLLLKDDLVVPIRRRS